MPKVYLLVNNWMALDSCSILHKTITYIDDMKITMKSLYAYRCFWSNLRNLPSRLLIFTAHFAVSFYIFVNNWMAPKVGSTNKNTYIITSRVTIRSLKHTMALLMFSLFNG